MKSVSHRLAALVIALAGLALPAAAQQPGSNAKNLPPHVAGHLWPQRELSPVEQELKDRVVTMRDTLTRVHATVAMLQRQHRARAATGVIRSTARTLAADCARSGRLASSMAEFAATFSTNDPKWGEPSVRAYRTALDDLVAGMRRCNESVTVQVEADEPNLDRLAAAGTQATEVVSRYDRAELDLFRTLKIRLDPRATAGIGGQ